MKPTHMVIDEAITTGGVVRITYEDYQGNVTRREVSPLEWESPVKFRAWCHLRDGERHFRVDRIQVCELVAGEQGGQRTAGRAGATGSQYQRGRSDSPNRNDAVAVRARRREGTKRSRRGGRPFTKVLKPDQWSRLVKYYTECLVRENQQQYVVRNSHSGRHFFNAEPGVIYDFLEGRVSLEFDVATKGPHSGIVSFATGDTTRTGRQLCLGYPMFLMDRQKMAPLVFAPVTAKEAGGKLRLSAEDVQPSYAVFDALGLSQEELATLLDECAGYHPEEDDVEVKRWEKFLIERLSQILNRPIEECETSDFPRAMALCRRPCLFWANPSIFTRSLINELSELAPENRWSTVPQALKQLLTNVPESLYEDPPPPERDDKIYVTEVNDQQRRTLTAVADQDVVVVTGPPGTGKSQTILNIVAQAVLLGRSVLFASRNNQAVDVVMDRLARELEFRGAIRTGGRSHRRAAATQMQATLDYVGTAQPSRPARSIRAEYSELTEEVREAETTLRRVRELHALLQSQRAERDSFAELLPSLVADLAAAHAPEYRPQEIDHLRDVLSSLLTTVFEARDEADEIQSDVWRIVGDEESRSPLLRSLHRFQDQWGAFGGGFLQPTSFGTLDGVRRYLETWLGLLEAFEAQKKVDHRTKLLREWQSSTLRRPNALSPQLQNEISSVAAQMATEELSSVLADAKDLWQRADDWAKGKQTLLERILKMVGLKRPLEDMANELMDVRESAGLCSDVCPEAWEDATRLAAACETTLSVVSATLFQSGLEDARALLGDARQTLRDALNGLPEPLQEDIGKVQMADEEAGGLAGALEESLLRVDGLVDRRNQLAARVNSKLDDNEDMLQLLSAFKASPAGDDGLLWKLRVPVSLKVIISHLTKWQHLGSFWEADAKIGHLKQQLDDLPTEEQALEAIRSLQREQFQTGARLVSGRWLERVKNTSTDVLQQARRYASAVEQLADGYREDSYAQLKSSQEGNFPSALRVFPVWATTNLSAKSNLPLEPGLFDIVIIDEASQCDVPSALPLVYRGKQLVVIGDPNQLRHIASLYEDSDLDSATAFNVSPDTFLYNRKSLFDLASASVGVRPGTIMLKEHYRSHHSIVEFSNTEFYDRQLVVRTDLRRQGIPKAFLKSGCGVFWVDIPGEAGRPSGGSAYNTAELRTLKELLPRLRGSLSQYAGSDYSFTLGVVTPFREQANRIQSILRQTIGEDLEVSAGTAHTFQGDERDIVILSSVVGPGLPEGTLRWLNYTENLLNVALTRPRLQLIVLGNWSFCRDLPPSSIYRRLADHLEDQTVSSYEHLPVFGGEPLDIAGTVIGETGTEAARLTLRRYLTESCEGFVWWLDRYFYDHVLDLFWTVFQQPDVDIQDVRLLTSREQVEASDRQGVQFHPDRIKATQGELQRMGIRLTVRLLPKHQLPHDRYLYTRDQSINMPPFGGAYGDHKHVTEYTRSSTDLAFFEEYWDRAEEL